MAAPDKRPPHTHRPSTVRPLRIILAAIAVVIALPAVAGALAAETPLATVDVDSGAGPTGRVEALAEANGLIYLAGSFTSIDGQPRSYLAAVDAATGELDPDWTPVADGEVHSLAVSPDGSAVYVGGVFGTIDGQPRARLAELDPLDGSPTAWNPGADADVKSLAATDTTVYAGGSFAVVGGMARARLAAIDAVTGATVAGWSADADGAVLDIEPTDTGIYVAGNFTTVGGTGQSFTARLDPVTGTPDGWAPTPPFRVLDMELDPDGSRIYLAVGGPYAGGGNQLEAYSTADGSRVWGFQSDGDFQAVTVTPEAVYAGGHFNFVGVDRYDHLLAADRTTGTLLPWNPGADSPWGVWALETGPSGILVGGDFATIGGTVQRHFAVFPDPSTVGPYADFDLSCEFLTCGFDGSPSTGDITGWVWDFGDGGTGGSGTTVSHTFGGDGTYQVTLTVTDSFGSVHSTTRPVEVVSPAPPGEIAFRGAAVAVDNSKSLTVPLAGTANPGDVALAFISMNSTAAVATPPPGWNLLGRDTDGSLATEVWTKLLGPGEAGTDVTVSLDSTTKTALTVAVYSGADPLSPVEIWGTSTEPSTSATHDTAAVSTLDPGLVVSYWADKSSATSSWTPPVGEIDRAQSAGTGGGHVSTLLTDSGTVSAPGPQPSLTATADSASNKATMWSISLVPAGQVTNGPRFVAASESSANAGSVTGTVPAGATAGDLLILFTSANSSGAVLTAPTGWTHLGRQVDGSLVTDAWTRVAATGEAGAPVTVSSDVTAKLELTLAAYRGIDTASPLGGWASADEPASTAAHTTPTVAVTDTGWVVSYWVDKTSTTTAWTAPAGPVVRSSSAGTGGGHVSTLLVDSDGTASAGSPGGLTATADSVANKATMWTLVLNPAPAV
ncbi:MAG TPA: PKD domain-containing protein [Acidimicrobiales bacterium]|nr:PKD domain-containing protein [Acidimicrobiales bacterium]